jgi:flavin-dependent dehydrogenase
MDTGQRMSADEGAPTTCDVLIAGGGPAGSSCAWALRNAGLDVLVVDKARFPRDKVCAGWITPQVIEDLRLDPGDYSRGRTFQPITAFRVGVIGRDAAVDVTYDQPVSFGIRRCEFDDYLLRRSSARLLLGTPITSLRRSVAHWTVNGTITARMLVGAGGHFCPVARMLNGAARREAIVTAQEVEFAVTSATASSYTPAAGRPELYFCRDRRGYGWCVRKEGYLNVGFGRLDAHALPGATAGFIDFLKGQQVIPSGAAWRWRGHAYLVGLPSSRRVVDEAALLVGDAAGLADPQSGEGIGPAIASGLMAASAILEADGRYGTDRLGAYARRLRSHFGASGTAARVGEAIPAWLAGAAAARLLGSAWFVRHIVLDRWFLHATAPALNRRPADSRGSS